MAIDLWQELPYKFKDQNQQIKSAKTIYHSSNIKREFSTFLLAFKLGNPSLYSQFLLCLFKEGGG